MLVLFIPITFCIPVQINNLFCRAGACSRRCEQQKTNEMGGVPPRPTRDLHMHSQWEHIAESGPFLVGSMNILDIAVYIVYNYTTK